MHIFTKLAASVLIGFASFGMGFYFAQSKAAVSADEKVDFTINYVSPETILADKQRYNGKLVSFDGRYDPLPDSSLGNIGWFRVICVAPASKCSLLPTYSSDKIAEVTLVGRFYSRVRDPHPNQRGENVDLIEISDITVTSECYDVTRMHYKLGSFDDIKKLKLCE